MAKKKRCPKGKRKSSTGKTCRKKTRKRKSKKRKR